MPLSQAEELIAHNMQTTDIRLDTPSEIAGLNYVVDFIEKHYLTNDFEKRPNKGSVGFHHVKHPQTIVRVWVNNRNRFSNIMLLNKPQTRLPIAVGIDLTGHPIA